MERVREITAGKRVLFISTKNKDYIRNQQEIRFLKKYAGIYDEIVFHDNSYFKRIFKVWFNCCLGRGKEADVIFVGFAPQLLFPFLYKWVKSKIVIIDFFISFYDTFVCDRKYFKDGFLIAKILHWIDTVTLKQCNRIVVDTCKDAEFFSEELHVDLDKMSVYYLEADREIYDAEKYEKKKQSTMSVLYFGSILPLQGIEVILGAAELLQKQKDIEFIIIGPVENFQHQINMGSYPNIKFYHWLSQEKLAEQIAQTDLCLAGHFNAEIEKAKRTIPGKAYIYEAMNKKMILGDNPANRELFMEDDHHIYVKMGSPEKLAEKIMDVRNDWRMAV